MPVGILINSMQNGGKKKHENAKKCAIHSTERRKKEEVMITSFTSTGEDQHGGFEAGV